MAADADPPPLSSDPAREPEQPSRRPNPSPWLQQKVPGYAPLLTPRKITVALFVLGVAGICVGLGIRANDQHEVSAQYGGHGIPSKYAACEIDRANEGTVCSVTLKIKTRMKAPVHVFYQVDNFYQNHNRYLTSYNQDQLTGTEGLDSSDLKSCVPLKKNGTKILSPCGVIANSMFNDVIALDSDTLTMRETNLAWGSDHHDRFKQPNRFTWTATDEDVTGCVKSVCPDSLCTAAGIRTGCMGYVCQGGDYDQNKCAAGQKTLFYYKDADSTQYLYETFPELISPLVGVKSEHFEVWMRLGGLMDWRKPYGRITSTLRKGDEVTFQITNNFDVRSFSGKKRIVLATAGVLGTKASSLWASFVYSGVACAAVAILFGAKGQLFGWRTLGDTAFLRDA
mmetsp:Transcript_24558/g.75733  ORF Transcript_24558/g.75733 Transcript_24558/m.75733 type:complete len:396 (+) Transcript_24558:283-1470(+)